MSEITEIAEPAPEPVTVSIGRDCPGCGLFTHWADFSLVTPGGRETAVSLCRRCVAELYEPSEIAEMAA